MRIALLADERPRQVVRIADLSRVYVARCRRSQLSLDVAERPLSDVAIFVTRSELSPLNDQQLGELEWELEGRLSLRRLPLNHS